MEALLGGGSDALHSCHLSTVGFDEVGSNSDPHGTKPDSKGPVEQSVPVGKACVGTNARGFEDSVDCCGLDSVSPPETSLQSGCTICSRLCGQVEAQGTSSRSMTLS